MENITGNITEVLTDVMIGTLGVILSFSMGELGPIEEDTADRIARDLGNVLSGLKAKADSGGYS